MSRYRREETSVRVSRPATLDPGDSASRRPTQRGSPSRARSRSRAAPRSRAASRSRADAPIINKRLIVACDGTWLNSDDGTKNGNIQVPSNVTRIARAIRPESKDGVQQVVYYQEGIGSEGLPLSRVVAGTVGAGLGSNVREGLSFLSNNYNPGDEIFLIGFSRGAFTARSMAGMISEVGLLTKRGLPYLVEIFSDVQHRRDQDYRPKNPDLPFPNKPSAGSPRYREELARRGMTDLSVKIKAVGVFDTVGALGVPRIGWLNKVGLQSSESDRMQFYDTKLSNAIENAFQALALDEKRSSFVPAVWEKPPGNTTNLRQVWFPGVHANVGGGYDDQELANITLAWMMAQLEPHLDFYRGYIIKQEKENLSYYRSRGKRVRPWSFGKLYDSKTGLYALAGSTVRTPGQYYQTDPHDSSRYLDRPLRDTHEYIHASVRTRIRLKGPGTDDQGRYDPEAMDDWRLVVEYPDGDDDNNNGGTGEARRRPRILWRARFRSENVSTRVLPEAPLWDLERDLLAMDPETEEYVLRPPPTKRSRRSQRLSGVDVANGATAAGRRARSVERAAVDGGGPPLNLVVAGAQARDRAPQERPVAPEVRPDAPGFDGERLIRPDSRYDPRHPTDQRPGFRVLEDTRDDRGGKRVIEEVGRDGKVRIVEEQYVVRKKGGPNGPLMRA